MRTAPRPCDSARLACAGWSRPAPTTSGGSDAEAAEAVFRSATFFFFFGAGGVTTFTIGSAEAVELFPAQSVAWIVTGKTPACLGRLQETVCQPPATER